MQIKINGKNHHVGYYDDEDKAGAAASAFRLEHMSHTNENRSKVRV